MGEMADYMLNGDDCSGCGVHIGPGDGFQRLCSDCKLRKPRGKRRIKMKPVGKETIGKYADVAIFQIAILL